MIKNNDIIFLVRSYNEGKYLLDTIKTIKDAGFKKVLVVDDGSKDDTYSKLKDRKDIYYIRHLINLGAGAALETGFEFIRRNKDKLNIGYVVTFDADGQHNISDVYNFIKKFDNDENLDVVLGSRFVENTHEKMPLTRKIVLLLGKFFTFFISNIKVTDPHNGYKMFKLSTIEKINIELNSFAYASELIDKIADNKLKFDEVPVNIIYTDYSLSKGQRSSNAINIAINMIWKKFFK